MKSFIDLFIVILLIGLPVFGIGVVLYLADSDEREEMGRIVISVIVATILTVCTVALF